MVQRKKKTTMDGIKKVRVVTSYIKHLAVSALSSVSARIKGTCNLTGKGSEMPNVSLYAAVVQHYKERPCIN